MPDDWQGLRLQVERRQTEVARMSIAAASAPTVMPPHRLARALVLTGTTALVGVGAHVAGGGTISLAAVGALPVLFGLVWPLTDRERGWLPIAGAQLAGQQVVHSVLEWTAHSVPSPVGLPSDVFLYLHVVAAALLAAWLRCAERRAWEGARRAVLVVAAHLRVLAGLLGFHAPTAPPPPPAESSGLPELVDVLLRHAVVRRGPPVHV